MALARRGKRKLVVQGQTYWCNTNFGYDQLWTDGGGLFVVRDDRKVRLELSAPGGGLVSHCLARVHAPELPWFAGRSSTDAFVVPVDVSPGWLPGVVAKVIAWCLDPMAERAVAPKPSAPAPAALPDADTVDGFVARVLRPPERDLQRVVDVVEEVLDRPIIARPLDPVARDLPRSRKLVALIWETLAVRGIVPNDWVDDPARGFVASTERALAGEPVTAVEGFDADCVALRTPPSLRCLIALASDVPGVLRAEALARESMGRFGSLCSTGEQRECALHWRVVSDTYADATVTGWGRAGWSALRTQNVAESALSATLVAAGRSDAVYNSEGRVGWPGNPRNDLAAAARSDRAYARRWGLACELGLRLPAETAIAPARWGSRFDELPDPYTPRMELWRSGYGLDWRVTGLALAAPDVPFD